MMKKIKEYAKHLCEEDAQIEEVVLIGSFANGNANNESDIDLVCVFAGGLFVDEGLDHPIMQAYKYIAKLWTKMEELEKRLNLGHPIDLGFMLEGPPIFMGGGLISNYAGKHKTLVKRSKVNHEQGQHYGQVQEEKKEEGEEIRRIRH